MLVIDYSDSALSMIRLIDSRNRLPKLLFEIIAYLTIESIFIAINSLRPCICVNYDILSGFHFEVIVVGI